MSKTPSLTHQLQGVFDSNLSIGASRHEAKQDMREAGRDVRGLGDRIHSWGTYKTELKNAVKVFKDIKAAYGSAVKYIRDVTPNQVKHVLDRYKADGLSPNTIVAREGALRRVEAITGHKLLPDHAHTKREFSPRGVYTDGEVKAIIADIARRDPHTALVLKVQYAFGLRLREAVMFRSDKVERRPGGLITAAVSGKGGRLRTISTADRMALRGVDLSKRLPLRDDRKQQTQMRAIERQVRTACLRLGIAPRGTHPIRAAAAHQLCFSLLSKGVKPYAALQAVRLWLGHGKDRPEILEHYGLSLDVLAQAGYSD